MHIMSENISEKLSGEILNKKLFGLYLISFISGFSMGVFNPLISIIMELRGISQVLIGANSTIYYLMVAVCAPLSGLLIKKYGINLVIVCGLFITATFSLIFPMVNSLTEMFVLRGLMGLGVSLYMIGGQTGLNLFANDARRGVIVAMHGASFGVGFMVSPLIGTMLYAKYPIGAFGFGSGVILVGIVVVITLLPNKKIDASIKKVKGVFRKISVPLHAVFIYGALEGIIVTLLPVYLLQKNIPIHLLGLPITLFMVASGIGMVPVSYFGDRLGRNKMLFILAIIGLLTLLSFFFVQHSSLIIVSSFILGLSLGTFFPITLAMIGERLKPSEMHTGSSWFTASFSYGCAAGPFVSAVLMKYFGDSFIFFLLTCFLAFLIIRMLPEARRGVNSV